MRSKVVTRIENIARGDACIPPIPKANVYRNPIDLWCRRASVVEKYGKTDALQLANWAKAKAPLDPTKDPPMPDWVVDVLCLGRIGYKGRVRIAMEHADDIARFQMLKGK